MMFFNYEGIKMKILLILLVTVVQLFSKSVENIIINNHQFALLKESYDEYGSKGETISFYSKEKDRKEDAIFAFVLHDSTGGCNDKSIEKGTYEINGTTLTFYTLWKRQGSVDDAPFGGKIQHYEVVEDGSFNLLSSSLYVETHTKDYDNNSGMRFLFEKIKTKEDKKALDEYVAFVEKNFHGKFVFENKADALIKEVRKALRRRMKARWKR